MHKGSLAHTKHEDASDDEASGTLWDRNAMDDESNAPTGSVTHSRRKSHDLTSKGFIMMSQCVNWLSSG